VCLCVCVVCVCNSRSTYLSNLNESCVVETWCNVLYFSDNLSTVEECCIIEGMYKIHVHNLYIVQGKMILYNYTCRTLSLNMTYIVEDNR